MKGKKIDYTGMTIGNLTILSLVKRDKGKSYWVCRCRCGNEFVGEVNNLKNRIENMGQKYCSNCKPQALLIHGDAKKSFRKKQRLYSIWQGMRYRCEKPYASHYARYGGRGIKVCDEWQDYSVFKEWALSNCYSNLSLSIDRIDSNGNYCPANCRWVTQKDQANNTKQVNYFTYKNKTYTLSELSELTGISYGTLDTRIRKGWSVEKVVETPHRTIRKRCVSGL